MPDPSYKPPFTVSARAIKLIAEIAAAIERYRLLIDGPDGIRLRRINRIKTIRGSTAIEGNSLSEEQVTAVLDGRRVLAPRREIDEVKGAAAAYEMIEDIDPCSAKDLLRVHKSMMNDLVASAGSFRTTGVAVVNGSGDIIHSAPPAFRVPDLVEDLFAWLRTAEDSPLVKSCSHFGWHSCE